MNKRNFLKVLAASPLFYWLVKEGDASKNLVTTTINYDTCKTVLAKDEYGYVRFWHLTKQMNGFRHGQTIWFEYDKRQYRYGMRIVEIKEWHEDSETGQGFVTIEYEENHSNRRTS